MKKKLSMPLLSVAILILLSILALNIGPVSADDGLPWPADTSGVTPSDTATLPAPGTGTGPPAGALVVNDNGFACDFVPNSPSPSNYPNGPYLWTGTDMNGTVPVYARAFFKFVVPPHAGNAFDVWLGAYCNFTKGNAAGTTAAYYFANNSWSQATLTWNSIYNQSFSRNKGTALDSVYIPFSANPPNKYYEWKVTSAAENIWKNSGTITLVLCAANESPSIYWRDFENKYYTGPNEAYLRAATRQTFIGAGPQSSSTGGVQTSSVSQPTIIPTVAVQSATLSAKVVAPGTPVTVTADIANKSSVNGNKKVTLYVNGQVETTQGVTVNSGSSSKLTFNVSRSEPGEYNVYVDGVPAGSFKVELFTKSDTILIFSAVLVALALLIGMVMLWRRQRSYN
ncbi:MAG: DNRLRE domain-containing protein [Dehalococcoidia bacterium]